MVPIPGGGFFKIWPALGREDWPHYDLQGGRNFDTSCQKILDGRGNLASSWARGGVGPWAKKKKERLIG